MIRTAYPIPPSSPFRQVRLRLDGAARRTRRALQARRHDLAAASPAPVKLPPVVAPTATIAPSAPSHAPQHWAQEKAALDAFYNQYDALTGLVCLAAQEGVTDARESRYQAARTWLMEAYPAHIQQNVAPYLEAQTTGDDPTACDPFACFWTPPTLVDLLQNDDGNLIKRMEQTQNALDAWEKPCVPGSLRPGIIKTSAQPFRRRRSPEVVSQTSRWWVQVWTVPTH